MRELHARPGECDAEIDVFSPLLWPRGTCMVESDKRRPEVVIAVVAAAVPLFCAGDCIATSAAAPVVVDVFVAAADAREGLCIAACAMEAKWARFLASIV